ncbi:MAG TPA: LysM peptidoglycan-binding domain-containing protein, partial [Acidimicrobiales bacterium]|nr:LysM peptidoglycan-binding domain-containing protein [Acidimicrobiales bacterium]
PGATVGYTVRPGDSLWSLAQRFHTTVGALAQANGIPNPAVVRVGRTLSIPGATVGYTVRPGDSLWSLAQRFHTTVGALAQANGIPNPAFVRAGRTLSVPGAGPGAGPAPSGAQQPDRQALVPVFHQAAAAAGIPVSLLEALAWQESGWQEGVVSPAGAIGIGQVLPKTAVFVDRYLVSAPLNPHVAPDNIRMSAALLGYLLHQTGGNVAEAVAGYYQGLNSVRAVGMFPGTRHYVANVLALQRRF